MPFPTPGRRSWLNRMPRKPRPKTTFALRLLEGGEVKRRIRAYAVSLVLGGDDSDRCAEETEWRKQARES